MDIHLNTNRSRIAAVLVSALLALLVFTPQVQAGKHVDRIVAGTASTGQAAAQFGLAAGLAVNYSNVADGTTDPLGASTDGYVYVADAGNHRIQVLGPDGAFKFMFGRDVVIPGGTGDVVGPNEIQTVTINGGPTGGSFTMRFGDSATQTDPIAFNASAAALEDGLETSSAIDPGDVSVNSANPGGGGSAGGPYTVTFQGRLADTDVRQLSGQAAGLIPAGSIAVATNAPGGNRAETCTDAADCRAAASGVQGGMFNQPYGVAIDQETGHVFVRDRDNNRVQEFEADGDFVEAWGWGVATGAAAFQACTTPTACMAGRVDQGEGNGNAGQLAPDLSIWSSTGIAVVPVGEPGAPNPNVGNVIVADPGNRRIMELDPSGAGAGVFVRLWGWDVVAGAPTAALEICATTAPGICKAGGDQGPTAAPRPVGWFRNNLPAHVAVDADGVVYASNSGPTPSGPGGDWERVDSFDSAQTTPAALAKSSFVVRDVLGVAGSAVTAGLDVDPSTGSLLVARSSNVSIQDRLVVEVGDPAGAASLVDTHYVGSGLEGQGVAADPSSGDLYLSTGSRVFAADDDGAGPALMSVEPPSGVSSRSVTLNGLVNSDGIFGTEWRFEVSRDGTSWTAVASGSIPGGNTDVPVSGVATGLRPNTLYLARLATAKEFGNPEVFSAQLTFSTGAEPPELAAVRADAVQDTTARLSGRVNPHSTQTSYRFEWGKGNFDNVVPLPDGSVGAGPSFVFVAERLSGLEPDTDYQFRLVGTNAEGPTTSPTRTFRTGVARSGAGARGFELVSPADKAGAVGLGWWYNGPAATVPSGFAAYDGERFAANSHNGGTLLDAAPIALANEIAFAERISDTVGWQSHPSIAWASVRSQPYRNAQPSGGSSDDLSTLAWVGNAGLLAPFPEMRDWHDGLVNKPLFVGDWQGRWELFGPIDLDQVVSPGDVDPAQASAVAADGGYVVSTTKIRGLAGAGDPSVDMAPRPAGSVYVDDVSAGVSNSFPGEGVRSLVQVCAAGTVLPARVQVSPGVFRLAERDCPAPAANRDASLVSSHGATLQFVEISDATSVTDRVISRDGSRVFFMSPDPAAAGVPASGCAGIGAATICPRQLYVRQRNADGSIVTRWISRSEVREDEDVPGSQDQAASLAGQAIFEGASADGSRVFFRSNAPLTADDPNGQALEPSDPRPIVDGTPSSNSWDLYMFELSPGADPTGPGSSLTRISAGPSGDGDCNSPFGSSGAVGALRFVSADGHRVYFTCAAPLPGVPAAGDPTRTTSPDGAATTSSATNLYTFSDTGDDSQWRFVARLPRGTGGSPSACATTSLVSDSPIGSVNSGLPPLGFSAGRCVRGTSDGAFVTLWTQAPLTVDDDPDVASMDIYGYDADSDELMRVTAPQGGVGLPYQCGNSGDAAQTACFGDPGYQYVKATLGVATDPLVPGDKVAFFQSASRLVPEDLDEAYDVYQWHNGELSLVSTGTSPTDGAFYKGNDRAGRNVYVVTRDRLTWQDHDAVLDAYTARTDGGIPQPPPPPICDVLAGACRGDGSDAVSPAGDSAQSGGANVSPSVRPRLSIVRSGAVMRRRAARTGVLPLKVRSNVAGRISVVARARLRAGHRGSRLGRVGKVGVRITRPGAVTVELRLGASARRHLRLGRPLRVLVRVSMPGARRRSATILLRRAGR